MRSRRAWKRSVLLLAVLVCLPTCPPHTQAEDAAPGNPTPMVGETTAGDTEATVETIFDAANRDYAEKRYEDAISGYLSLLELGVRSPQVYYNLGNAYYRTNKLGRALASYLQAERLDPRGKNIAHNISVVKDRTTDKIPQSQLPGFIKGILFWHFYMNQGERIMLLLAVWVVLWLVLTVLLVRNRRWLKQVAVVCALFALGLFASCTMDAYNRAYNPCGVVVVPEVKVRAGDSPDATTLFELHDGAEVYLEGEKDGWLLIHLTEQQRGWLPKDSVEII